jgi:SAM-dependent methyltransferase
MKPKSKITIESYNKTAEEYYKIVTSFEILPELEKFINLIPKKGNILDLGCGPGHHSRVFVDNGFNVEGIDLSTEMIAIAKKEVTGANFKVVDILDLNLKKESFDGIWASASLLHVPKKNLKSVLKQLKSALTIEGVLYISLKKGEGSEVLKDNRYGGVDKYYVYYQLEEIEKILASIDFKVIKKEQKEKRDFYDTNPWIHVFAQKKIELYFKQVCKILYI